MKDQKMMIRNINSAVGHFVAECNLETKTTVIRDPRNGFQPVAFVPSVLKSEILQAIRRIGQKAKLEKSFELLGIQSIKSLDEINLELAKKHIIVKPGTSGNDKETTRVRTPLRASGSLPLPPTTPVKKETIQSSAKASAKGKKPRKQTRSPGKDHGW